MNRYGFAISRAKLVIDLGSINYGVWNLLCDGDCRFWKEEGESKITYSSSSFKEDEPYGLLLRRRLELRKEKVSAGFMLISQVLKKDRVSGNKLIPGDDFKR